VSVQVSATSLQVLHLIPLLILGTLYMIVVLVAFAALGSSAAFA